MQVKITFWSFNNWQMSHNDIQVISTSTVCILYPLGIVTSNQFVNLVAPGCRSFPVSLSSTFLSAFHHIYIFVYLDLLNFILLVFSTNWLFDNIFNIHIIFSINRYYFGRTLVLYRKIRKYKRCYDNIQLLGIYMHCIQPASLWEYLCHGM